MVVPQENTTSLFWAQEVWAHVESFVLNTLLAFQFPLGVAEPSPFQYMTACAEEAHTAKQTSVASPQGNRI